MSQDTTTKPGGGGGFGSAAPGSATAIIKAVVDEVVSLYTDGETVNLVTDLYRRLRIVSAAFDSLLDADKTATVNPESANRDSSPQQIAAEDDTAAGTYNYPSDDGLEVGDRDQLGWIMKLDDVTSVAFQVSEDGTNWVDVTDMVIDETTGAGSAGYAAAHYTSAAAVDTFFACSYSGRLLHRYCRWRVVYPDNTNEFDCELMQRAL